MKIVLITYEFYPEIGGISQNFNSLCKAFRNSEHILYIFNKFHKGNKIYNVLDKNVYSLKDIKIFLKNKKLIYYFLLSIRKILSDKSIPFSSRLKMAIYLFIKPKISIKCFRNLFLLIPYLKTLDMDLIFGNTLAAEVLILIYLLSRILKKRAISFAHGNEFLVRSNWSIKTNFIKAIDKIILSNNRTKILIKKIHHLEEHKLEVIHYGLILNDYEIHESKDELRSELNIPREKFILTSVGRHVPRKKFDLVIQAIDKIKKNHPSITIKYYLIGEGSFTPYLKNLTNQLDLEKEVEFLGAFGGLKKNKYIKSSDLFLMPSIALKESIEGFGIVFLEANYYKIPVIGAYSGGMGEAIVHGQTGFLIKQNDLKDLIEKIMFFYTNEEKRKEMGERGYSRVIKEFNWKNIIDDYIRLFNKLLEN